MAWSNPPTVFTKTIRKAAVKRVKDFSKDMLTAVAQKSPVDTSRFVSNNNVSIGERGNEFRENDFSGRNAAISRGVSVIDAMPEDKLQDIWIYNDTPYGIYLEDTMKYRGSPQSPNGVYRVSFLGIATWYK